MLLAGLIHALWNIAAKKAGGDARFACFTALVLMVFWAPVGLWLGWQQVPAWGAWEWALVVASALLHVGYFIILLRGYRKADLTVVYPLARGSGPLLSSMAAIVLLGSGLSIPYLFLVTGILNAAVALFIYKLVPDLPESAEFTRELTRTWTRFRTGK